MLLSFQGFPNGEKGKPVPGVCQRSGASNERGWSLFCVVTLERHLKISFQTSNHLEISWLIFSIFQFTVILGSLDENGARQVNSENG